MSLYILTSFILLLGASSIKIDFKHFLWASRDLVML